MKCEIADWCHEAAATADLLEERGASAELLYFLRNASTYAAAYMVCKALDTPRGEGNWLGESIIILSTDAIPPNHAAEQWDNFRDLIHHLGDAHAWLEVWRALLIQE